MITIAGKYHVHNAWEELTPDEFTSVVGMLMLHERGKMSLLELRTRLFCTIAKIKRYVPAKYMARFSDNIYRAALHMNFCYKFLYMDERFKNLSPEMQQRLEKTPPEDIDEPEAVVARKFKRAVTLDACFGKQLLPSIRLSRKQHLKGYTFEVVGALADTNLSAEQYVVADAVHRSYRNDGDERYLNMLVAILYCPQPFSSARMQELTPVVAKLSPVIKRAVLVNFEAITQFMATKTKYSVMFSSAKTNDKKEQSTGLSSVLYSLAEKGYGSLNEVSGYSVITLFDLMLKSIEDTVCRLANSGMDKAKIAAEMSLPIEVIVSMSKK